MPPGHNLNLASRPLVGPVGYVYKEVGCDSGSGHRREFVPGLRIEIGVTGVRSAAQGLGGAFAESRAIIHGKSAELAKPESHRDVGDAAISGTRQQGIPDLDRSSWR